ncbi:MAG: hypothetical protein U0872_04645 [Planctomycetaceae bacterium]
MSRTFRCALANGAENDVVYFTALDNPREKVQARVIGWHEAEIIDAPVESPAIPTMRQR